MSPESITQRLPTRGPTFTVRWGGTTLAVDVGSRPLRAGRELTFAVRGLEATGELPLLDFTMPGMDMGVHRAPLVAAGGEHLARMTLTTCPQGGSRWRLRLLRSDGSVPADAGELVFDVAP